MYIKVCMVEGSNMSLIIGENNIDWFVIIDILELYGNIKWLVLE